MPKLGLTMTEGQIVEWPVAGGQRFGAGDVIVIVETEKIANEVEAPAEGELLEILVEPGETVAVGAPLARWSLPDDGTEDAPAPDATEAPAPPADPAPTAPSDAPPVPAQTPTSAAAAASGRLVATPYARRLARERGVDLAAVSGSGPGGRIKAADVPAQAAPPAAAPTAAAKLELPADAGLGRLEAPSAYERAAAPRMVAAKATVPHFYLASEVEVSALQAQRQRLNAEHPELRLSLTHLIVAAVGCSLEDLPQANRVWRDGGVLHFEHADVGLAIDTAQGLYAPVLRDTARKGLATLARETRELVQRARDGALQPDDSAGSAITISNAGMHDVTYMTPIITPGQSAILGVGSVRELFRPDADGQPALRRELGLVLACDHRLYDGVSGLALLNRIRGYLQDPLRLLLR